MHYLISEAMHLMDDLNAYKQNLCNEKLKVYVRHKQALKTPSKHLNSFMRILLLGKIQSESNLARDQRKMGTKGNSSSWRSHPILSVSKPDVRRFLVEYPHALWLCWGHTCCCIYKNKHTQVQVEMCFCVTDLCGVMQHCTSVWIATIWAFLSSEPDFTLVLFDLVLLQVLCWACVMTIVCLMTCLSCLTVRRWELVLSLAGISRRENR